MAVDGYQKVRKSEYIMSSKCIKVLRLRLNDKLTYDQISERLGMSKSTIANIIKIARLEFPGVKELQLKT